MPTDKIVLRTVDEFMSDYTPVYQPIYPLFLSKSQQYEREVGRMDFRRVQAVGDIRAKHITPKDTEIRQVNVTEGKKSFKKYFLATQFQLSEFQNREGVEDTTTQVLDEHQLQADELFLFGDGTSNSNMLNNGLYYSADANYVLNDSTAIAAGDSRLTDFHSKVVATATQADDVAGRKLILFYGSGLTPVYDSIYPAAAKAWKTVLKEVLGDNYSFAKLPTAATPAGANGWIVANLDQVKLHYTDFPSLMNQGENEEKMYLWFNFVMGSMMTEVLAKGGVIRQPATLA
jgi:hypothetical protein